MNVRSRTAMNGESGEYYTHLLNLTLHLAGLLAML